MLTDLFNRRHDYLRVSVTDRCNLRCVYCMPEAGLKCMSHADILRSEEFLKLIEIFVSLGIRKIRFTGGEPLVRSGFVEILRKTRELSPDLELAVTTNGVILGDYIEDFRKLGIRRINISLDTLSRKRFAELTRRDMLPQVLENIDKALASKSFLIKLNAVLFDETLEELDDFISYCSDRNLTLRFIERMPFSYTECSAGFTSSDMLLNELKEKGSLIRRPDSDSSVSFCYDLALENGKAVSIGIIPPVSHKFCYACNRIRLTADGQIKTCLLSPAEYNIKDSLRRGAERKELEKIILSALEKKDIEHHLDKTGKRNGEYLDNTRPMSKIGG